MYERPFGKHYIKFVVDPRPGLNDGRCIAQAADCALHHGQITTGDDCWRLVVDPHLER